MEKMMREKVIDKLISFLEGLPGDPEVSGDVKVVKADIIAKPKEETEELEGNEDYQEKAKFGDSLLSQKFGEMFDYEEDPSEEEYKKKFFIKRK